MKTLIEQPLDEPLSPDRAKEFKDLSEKHVYQNIMREINQAIDDYIPGQALEVTFDKQRYLRRPLIAKMEEEFKKTWAAIEIKRTVHGKNVTKAILYDKEAWKVKNGFEVHVVGPEEARLLSQDEIVLVERVIRLVNNEAKTKFYTSKVNYVPINLVMREFVKDEIVKILKKKWKVINADYKPFKEFLVAISFCDKTL